MRENTLTQQDNSSQLNQPVVTSRLASPDILKAIAILSVVFIHGSSLIPYRVLGPDFTPSELGLGARALRFCVPIFIFLWAYFSEKSTLKRGPESMLPRLRKLAIPFIFWSLVYMLLTANFKHLGIGSVMSKHWSGYGWSGQYYFIILFQLIILFPIIRFITHKISGFLPVIYIVSILFYCVLTYSGIFNISVVSKINDRLFIYWIPYVVLGILYANKSIFRFSAPLIVAGVLLTIIPLEIYWLHPKSTINYLLPSIFICTLLLVSTMEAKLTYNNLPNWLSKLVHSLASQTLGIFCLNPLIIILLKPLIKSLGYSMQFPGASIFSALLSTSLITVLCILTIQLLKKIKLGFLASN
jgi:surface polysaccharide O-acyltransferase-like enzyme